MPGVPIIDINKSETDINDDEIVLNNIIEPTSILEINTEDENTIEINEDNDGNIDDPHHVHYIPEDKDTQNINDQEINDDFDSNFDNLIIA